MPLEATLIRIACNQSARGSFVNAFGGLPPVLPRAGSVQMPCAIFLDDPDVAANLVTDLGNLVSAHCVIRSGRADGAVVFEQAIPAAGFNPGLTFEQWTTGTAAHFEFALSPTDTNLPAGPLHIAVGVTTTDAGSIPLAYCANACLRDYGLFHAGAPAAPDYTSWSKAEADARYAPAGGGALASGIHSVGDGAADALERLATARLPLPTLRTFLAAGFLQNWVLEAGTDADSADPDGRPCVQRPDDFHPVNNPRVWTRYPSL